MAAHLLSPALVATIRRATTALKKAKINYAIIGAVALGARGHRRFTEDVDLLVDPEKWREAKVALAKVGIRHEAGHNDDFMAQLQDRRTGAGVDLLFAVGDPEESARESATEAMNEGIKAPTAQAEYLVWLYLLSDRAQHEADAIEIIAKKKVNIQKLRRLLRAARVERELHPRLSAWIIRAKIQRKRSSPAGIRRYRREMKGRYR